MRRSVKINVIVSLLTLGLLVCNNTFNVTKVNAKEEKTSNEDSLKEYQDEEVRVIIELEEKSVADNCKSDELGEYDKKLQEKEKEILDSQSDVVKEVEKITSNTVKKRNAYLVNTISIDAKRSDIDKLSKVKGVKNISEAPVVKIPKANIKSEDIEESIEKAKEANPSKYDGSGMVVAVIDSGINVEHPDLKLDDGVKTKFTKEEWQEKIDSLGYGAYLSDKIPFGYDYVDCDNDIYVPGYAHGTHVSGIIAANGKIKGVCPNAQIVGLRVVGESFTDGNEAIDDVIKALEDAIKLDVDVINMSLIRDHYITPEEDMYYDVIKKVHDAGIILNNSVGNYGRFGDVKDYDDDIGVDVKNEFNMNDGATLGIYPTYDECISVGAAYVPGISEEYTKEELSEKNKDLDGSIARMSFFSSWGPNMDLSIKPEITAPGENIRSTIGNKAYGYYGGTSMSSPYMAGVTMRQLAYLKDKNYNLADTKINDLAKIMLMNTADTIYDVQNHGKDSKIPYSIRWQGSGLVNMDNALNNEVTATYNKKATVELGELKDNEKNIEIEITNYSNKDVSYTLSKQPLYRPVTNENDIYCMEEIKDAYIEFETEKVDIEANSSKKVSVKIVIPKDFDNNQFVEGFVKFNGVDVPSLSLPLLSFYGDWSNEAIFAESLYDSDSKTNYAKSCLARKIDYSYEVLGAYNKGDKVAFSPNDDGKQDEVYVCPTRLRNSLETKVDVIDSNGEIIRNLATYKNLWRQKDIKYLEPIKTFEEECYWNGKIFDADKNEYKPVEDGQYYIKISGKVQEDGKEQILTMPVKVDTIKPTAKAFIRYNSDKEKILYISADDNVGLDDNFKLLSDDASDEEKTHRYSYKNGEIEYSSCKEKDGYYIVNLNKQGITNDDYKIEIKDAAGNSSILDSKNDIKIDNAIDNEEWADDKESNKDKNDYKGTYYEKESYIEPICPISDVSLDIDENEILKSENSFFYSNYLLDEVDDKKIKVKFKVDLEDVSSVSCLRRKTRNDEYASDIDVKKDNDGYYYFNIDDIEHNYYYELKFASKDDDNEYFYEMFFTYDLSIYNSEALSNTDENEYNYIDDSESDIQWLRAKEIDNSILDDGKLTIKGRVKKDLKSLKINKNQVKINDDNTFCEEIKPRKGISKLVVEIETLDNNIIKIVNTIYNNELSLDLEQEGLKDDIIDVDETTFDLKGTVNTYINTYEMNINGNNVRMLNIDERVEKNGELIKKDFTHQIELKEGVNNITVNVKDVCGNTVEKTLKVRCNVN